MKRFGNGSQKVQAILSVFQAGEKLKGKEIAERLAREGYPIKDGHLKMFIYYNMLYKHLKKEDVKGTNLYSLIT
jgi:hypothetical protein